MPLIGSSLNQKKAKVAMEEASATLEYFSNKLKNNEIITEEEINEGLNDIRNALITVTKYQ